MNIFLLEEIWKQMKSNHSKEGDKSRGWHTSVLLTGNLRQEDRNSASLSDMTGAAVLFHCIVITIQTFNLFSIFLCKHWR